MLADLPPHLIILIYSFLDNILCILSASLSCKLWRETLLNSSKIKLKNKQRIRFICGNRGNTLSEQQIEISLKLINHVETLVFEWSICRKDKLICFLERIVTGSKLNVKQICVRQRNKSQCTNACKKRHQSESVRTTLDNRVAEHFMLLLKHCVNLRSLDFGFAPHLVGQASCMEDTINKLFRQGLCSLNVACFPYIEKNNDLLFEALNHLKTVSTLCLNWDDRFVKMVKNSLLKDNHEVRLKELSVVISSMSSSVLCSLSSIEWSKLATLYSDLKLRLVIVEDKSYPEELYNQLDNLPSNIPVYALNIISQHHYTGAPTNILLALRHYMNSVLDISLHYAEIQREHQLSHFSFFFTDFSKYEKLQRLEFCGFFIEDSTVLDIATKFGKRLRDLVIYQMDVVRLSYVTGYLVLLTRNQLNALERWVSVYLGVSWKLVKTRHINRSLRDEPEMNIQCVLQDCGTKVFDR